MGMTISEKILAKASGKKRVSPREVVRARPYFSTSNDFYTYSHWASRLERLGLKKLRYPERTVVVADHFIPSANIAWADNRRGLQN